MLIFLAISGLTFPFRTLPQFSASVYCRTNITKLHLSCLVFGLVCEGVNTLNIFVYKCHCCIWFVPSTLFSEFMALGF